MPILSSLHHALPGRWLRRIGTGLTALTAIATALLGLYLQSAPEAQATTEPSSFTAVTVVASVVPEQKANRAGRLSSKLGSHER